MQKVIPIILINTILFCGNLSKAQDIRNCKNFFENHPFQESSTTLFSPKNLENLEHFILNSPIARSLFTNTKEGKDLMLLIGAKNIDELARTLSRPPTRNIALFADALKNKLKHILFELQFIHSQSEQLKNLEQNNPSLFQTALNEYVSKIFATQFKLIQPMRARPLFDFNAIPQRVLPKIFEENKNSFDLMYEAYLENIPNENKKRGLRALFQEMNECVHKNKGQLAKGTLYLLLKDRLEGHSSNFLGNLEGYGWEGIFGKEFSSFGVGEHFSDLVTDQTMGGIGGIGYRGLMYLVNSKKGLAPKQMIFVNLIFDQSMKISDAFLWYEVTKRTQEYRKGEALSEEDKISLFKKAVNRYTAGASFSALTGWTGPLIDLVSIGSMCVFSKKFPGATIAILGMNSLTKISLTTILSSANIEWRKFMMDTVNPAEKLDPFIRSRFYKENEGK